MPRNKEAATSSPRHSPPQHIDVDVPTWLRRPYTRTIPKEIRTIVRLKHSFEDVRKQWQDLCKTYTHAQVESTGHVLSATEGTLSHEVRSAVDRLVSQLKSVKQELLAHLSTLSGALAATSASLATEATASPLPAWVADLMGRSSLPVASSSCVEHISEEMRGYLQAVWLARRVWVWSVCFACILMDLELLSGSVSVAAELFFGNAFATGMAPEQAETGGLQSASFMFGSPYNMNGSITEALLYEAVEMEATAESQRRTGSAAAHFHGADFGSQISAQVEDEACEIRAFFGYSAASAENTTGAGAWASRLRGGLHSATTGGDGNACSPETSALAPVRDLFWVQTVSLCYSVMVRDDRSAARLLTVFEAAERALSAKGTKSCPESDLAACSTLAATPDEPGSSEEPTVLWDATAFVLLVAKHIVDDDYNAVQQLLCRAGFHNSDLGHSVDGEGDGLRSSLAALCPQGVILRFLIRLLEEHVVRRRWIDEGLGKAFRPMEPPDASDDAAAAVSSTTRAPHLHRLACTLENRASAVAAAENVKLGNAGKILTLFQGTQQFCDALQIAALRNMGGDWPMPPPLLGNTVV
ncbi:hypothetical protein JKF63_02278 [Porcisia hertigi]|uniref:Uncharacterized protein n=1 Tax=Porcisia hertigi TaxID=2761500 RepID=A0A836IID4_9TRYP|nr:hypothetical protein JKF63_02278 [Porcisia hertigi]